MDALRLEHAPSHTPGGQGLLMRKRGEKPPFSHNVFYPKEHGIPCVSITERRMATCAGPDESAANWTYAAATDGCGRRRCISSLAAIGAMEGYATPSAAPRAGTRSPTPILPTPHMSGTWVPPAARTNPEGLPSPLCKERRPRRHGSRMTVFSPRGRTHSCGYGQRQARLSPSTGFVQFRQTPSTLCKGIPRPDHTHPEAHPLSHEHRARPDG